MGSPEPADFSNPSIGESSAAEADPGSTETEDPEGEPSQNLEPAAGAEQDPRDSRHVPVRVEVKVDRNDGGTVAGFVQQVVGRAMAAHNLPSAYVEQRGKTFAAPEDFSKSRRILDFHHVVVVVAEQDAGRHHAAVTLLAGRGDVVPRQVFREPGDRLDLDALQLDRSSGWLLDLRNDTELDPSFGLTLWSLQDQLRDKGSYLVVIVQPNTWSRVCGGAEPLEYRLARVPARVIVRKQLSVGDRPVDPEPYLREQQLVERLSSATPAEALRHAQVIETVHYSGDETLVLKDTDADTARWTADDRMRYRIDAVLRILNNWRKELLDWHIANGDSFVRNYLLAAAAMEGGTAGAVFEATVELAVALGESGPDVAGQRGPGILELTRKVRAELADDDRVKFTRPGYADAVLDYFWADRQHLRARFVKWLGALPRIIATDRVVVANRVAQYVLRWTERQGEVELLRTVTNEWAVDVELRPVVADLVTAVALRDDDVGKRTRADLLAFAKRKDEAPLPLLAAAVCGGPWGLIHPRLALRRLGEIGQNSDPEVRQAVVDAIGALWARQDADRHILGRVVKWCEDPGNRPLGATVFLALAALHDRRADLPELARTDESGQATRDQLIKGWRAVLDTRPPAAGEVLASWLGAAIRYPAFQADLAELLASAAKGWQPGELDERRPVFLTRLLYRWAPVDDDSADAESRARVRDVILSHVHLRV
ncbi:hypothetical protein FPZ12_016150 [Amycolatopsis acidicola]|uniref:Uncharacterized protein n=1 Tax=Amycolatopsis acidicola TaxID=2596893 RepID=A0A5N0V844_9PSEU|nr:hypothetical protein [Amycolatopsis acidicola]KAA9160682.1 hypothetical protein FPZ12_016150 [Amycolatopsis acidicola]